MSRTYTPAAAAAAAADDDDVRPVRQTDAVTVHYKQSGTSARDGGLIRRKIQKQIIQQINKIICGFS